MSLATPLRARPGTPLPIVQACHRSIAAAARPYGVVRVETTSAGTASRNRAGGIVAPIEARVVYARLGGLEVRQTRLNCRLDAAGRVVAYR